MGALPAALDLKHERFRYSLGFHFIMSDVHTGGEAEHNVWAEQETASAPAPQDLLLIIFIHG